MPVGGLPFRRVLPAHKQNGGWATFSFVMRMGKIKFYEAWAAPPRRCHSLHSNNMLNRGYAYTTIISSKYHGRTLLSAGGPGWGWSFYRCSIMRLCSAGGPALIS